MPRGWRHFTSVSSRARIGLMTERYPKPIQRPKRSHPWKCAFALFTFALANSSAFLAVQLFELTGARPVRLSR